MKNATLKNWWILFFILITLSCQKKVSLDLSKEVIIPKPNTLTATNSSFELNAETAIYYSVENQNLGSTGEYLAAILRPSTGYRVQIIATESLPEKNAIIIVLSEDTELGEEGYQLDISENLITITGNHPQGCFNGVQTLRQILPSKIEKNSLQEGPWLIATGTISDKPVYSYRGAMLDVSRHFFTVEEVKRYIDLLAAFKLNTLHLHLSDDQGWRIEIKSRPKLTEIGGSTEVGGGEGGFYTQEQYKDLVQYAADRFITIIPEIDMPGHTNAALASYPELNCDGKPRDLYTGTEVGFSTFCTDSEATYAFIDDVIRELSEMTPGPYIHIGGDESHVTAMEDYIPFIERTQEIVKKYGKKVIGWDEIAHAQLADDAVVQFWAKAENAIKGINQGAKVLMSPANRAYLDMQYDSTTKYGLHWAAYIEINDAYNWDPASYNPEIKMENVIGVESPIWSETLTNIKEIEYMAFPRIICHAEIGWTKKEDRNWDEFKNRLASFCSRLEAMEINYYQSPQIPWK